MLSPRKKRIVACDLCRSRKVKCNGQSPCDVCVVRKESCAYTRQPRKRTLAQVEGVVDERLARLEGLMHVSEASASTSPINSSEQNQSPQDRHLTRSVLTHDCHVYAEQTNADEQGILSTDTNGKPVKYHGPQSFMSVCSRSAITWICSKLGNTNYQAAALRLIPIITGQMFQLQSRLSPDRKPDPPLDEAWDLVRTYFAEAPEAPFGVVRRDVFESNLRALQAGTLDDEQNLAWYAIRNTVFATGCRIKYAKTLGFSAAVEMASGWFENAMSVHTELLYMRTSIIGVRALVVMAYYAEGIGGPLIPYILSSCAIRLACVKGLHRHASSSWELADDETRRRSWLFWSAYCVDRYIAASSGRPTAVDDSDITCEVPDVACTGKPIDVWYCRTMTRLAKLHSRASRELFPNQTADVLVHKVEDFKTEIQSLRSSTAAYLPLDSIFVSGSLSPGLHRDMALRVLFKYYELLFCVHGIIVHPWLRASWKAPLSKDIEKAIEQSQQVLTTISRQALLNMAEVSLDPSCRMSMCVTLPLAASINMFERILANPSRPTVSSELAILDLGVAHFSRLEASSEGKYSLSFVGELAELARGLHQRVSAGEPEADSNVVDSNDEETGIDTANLDRLVKELLDSEWWNEEFENWDINGWL